MQKQTATSVITLRVPKAILKALDKRAEKEQRTRPDLIRLVLRAAVSDR